MVYLALFSKLPDKIIDVFSVRRSFRRRALDEARGQSLSELVLCSGRVLQPHEQELGIMALDTAMSVYMSVS